MLAEFYVWKGLIVVYSIVLIICVVVELYCFQKQRAILEIGRVLGFDASKLILPPWFIIMWILPFITMFCISQVFSVAWYYAILIYIVYMLISSRLPIMKFFYIDALDKLKALERQGEVNYTPYIDLQIAMLYEKFK